MLKPSGHDFMTAGNGIDALALFCKGGIDPVISDYGMPGMKGPELFAKAKGIDPDASLIFMTGLAIAQKGKGAHRVIGNGCPQDAFPIPMSLKGRSVPRLAASRSRLNRWP